MLCFCPFDLCLCVVDSARNRKIGSLFSEAYSNIINLFLCFSSHLKAFFVFYYLFVQIICAGYCAYGSATEMVLTYGHGVERFTLDPSLGEFVMTAENMRIPEQGKTIYSINEGVV